MTTVRKQANQAIRDVASATNQSRIDRAGMVRSLKAMGYEQLGRGCFAVALAHPERPEVVVKVGQRRAGRSGFSHLKDGFPKYCEFLRSSGTTSKYALKVYHFEEVSHWGGGTYAAVVERCRSGKGCKAQKSIEAASYLAKGSMSAWLIKDADRHATRFIRRFAHLAKLDLHSANVMLRANGHPVITDPLC